MKTKEASQEVYLPSDVMASHGRDRSGWRFPRQKWGSGFEELPVPDIFSRSGTKTILDCRNCRHDRGRVGELSKSRDNLNFTRFPNSPLGTKLACSVESVKIRVEAF